MVYLKSKGRFNASNLKINLKGSNITWSPGMKDTLNLKGTTTTLDGADGDKGVSLDDGLISRSGWSLIDDAGTPLLDDSTQWIRNGRNDGSYDCYFFGYGHKYKKALYDFTLVSGKIPMVPRYILGYWWSRYWTYSDDELRKLISDFRFYNIPIDVLVIDMDWHETFGLSSHSLKIDEFFQRPGWTGYTWNKNLFPEPVRFLEWAKSEHLKVALNLHPASGIASTEEKYSEFARNYQFDTTGLKNIPFRIEDKKWVDTWFSTVLHPLEKQGINIWWLDWQQWKMNKSVRNLTNVLWLNHVFFKDKEKNDSLRPFVFHRYGGLGNHRYPVGFSGDTYSTWNSLKYQPYFTATAANACYDYWSHDIGGHFSDKNDPELYLRWIQTGVFSPMLRTHSTKTTVLERRIWKYPDLFERMRDAFVLRYSIIPYLYNATRKTFDSAVAMCRPLYHDYPEVNEAYEYKTEYMFGDNILAAPVCSKVNRQGLAVENIWLPEGNWYEWCSGTILKGNAVGERGFLLEDVPFYVKEGAIIPMFQNINNLQTPNDTLYLYITPGKGRELNYYEDDGITQGYKRNEFAITKIEKKIQDDRQIKLIIHPRIGHFKGESAGKRYILRFPCMYTPERVTVNSAEYLYSSVPKPGAWSYIANELAVEVNMPLFPCSSEIIITLSFTGSITNMNYSLSGMKGNFKRMEMVTQLIKNEVNRVDQIANAPSMVLKAASIPVLIGYNPSRTKELTVDYNLLMTEMFKQLRKLPRINKTLVENVSTLIPALNGSICGKPVIHLSKRVSEKPVQVNIHPFSPADEIRFTLDGKEPDENSSIYTGEFTINKTCIIQAKAFSRVHLPGYSVSDTFRLKFAKKISLLYPNSPQYSGSGKTALIDGKFASPYNFHERWVGFEEVDMVANIKLCRRHDIKSVILRFLNDQNSWIFLPVNIMVEVSKDGKKYSKVFEKNTFIEANTQSELCDVKEYPVQVNAKNMRWLRITVKNMGRCPAWHKGDGNKCWLFSDEIIVE